MTPPLLAIIQARLRAQGYFILGLRGRCMEPLLFEGDRAFIMPIDEMMVGILALVLLNDGSLALHRVVAIEPDAVTTKGDYAGKVERIAQSRLFGVARKFSLDGGSWVEDPRNRKELADLAALSLSIGHRADKKANEEARALIWELNESARTIMMKRAEHDCG